MKTTPIWINARFLNRPITGVERVAQEIIHQLAQQANQSGEIQIGAHTLQLKLIAPTSPQTPKNPWSNIPLHIKGSLHGHLWEQTELAYHTSGQWLLNLCNTAPLFKKRQWVFLHDAQPYAIPENFTPALRHWYKTLYRTTGQHSAAILTNSHFSAKELQNHAHIPEHKLNVLHLGADHLERIQTETTPRLHELFQTLQSPFVLAVSSNNPNKNFQAVTQALQQLGTQAPLCILVGGQNKRVFSQQNIDSEKLIRLGYVSDAELNVLYQKASLLLFPSHYEGFGLPPIEAMWHGCPVIASNTAALPEILGNAATYCDPTDPSTLAKGIQTIMSANNEHSEMKRQARQQARQYQWASTARKLLSVIKESLDSIQRN
jgi:glycosyltransferase involved in cell wall biosynthesis